MAEVWYTRNLFLRGLSMIYLFAFVSFYVQIPGLYGNNGILPARNQLADTTSKTLSEKIHNKPTLLWFAPYLGLNTEYMMDVLALTGIFLSFTGFISQKFCTAPIFGALWSLYYSLYQVGQTFMWFQWDILLLEAGFISIFVAPFRYQFISKRKPQSTPSDHVTFWLVKWLLFRLMFASGVVKLQSECPTWWGLTALTVHFESQPLPTIVAWYMHHCPVWFLKLGTVYAQVVEQVLPFLFFFPLRSVRIVGFYNQVFLQLSIIISGNYNFFNFLTTALCFSLLDDQYFFTRRRKNSSLLSTILSVATNILVHGFVIYLTARYYSLRPNPNWTINSEIAFTKAEFDQFLKRAVPASIYVGGISLIATSIYAIFNSFKVPHGKLTSFLVTLFYVSAAFFLFGVSLVPYSVLHRSSNSTIMPPLRKLYSKIDHLQIANSYGLFRRMTGVGGRPEIILEGANDVQGPWAEYHFRYKPGDVNSSLPIVAPHQPRLDWQMWFAALGTYHQNPWLMSVAYRLLEGEKSVIQLIDTQRLPYSSPPKYLKASLYHYHYTSWNQRNQQTWWKREKVGEYFPIFTKDHPPLIDYLKSLKILDSKDKVTADDKLVLPWAKLILDYLRDGVARADPVLLIWSLFSAGLAIIIINPSVTSGSSKRNLESENKK